MKQEPTATEALAHLGAQIAEFASWVIIIVAIAGLWIGTP